MRGTKLQAWQFPAVWNGLKKNLLETPKGSTVPQKQEILRRSTESVLEAIANDIRLGLLATVGIESSINCDGGRSSMVLELAAGTDVSRVAQAIDAENVEAWVDDEQRVNIAVSPWFSTKDVDQTVLSATKIVHVMLGLHAVCKVPTLKQRFLASVIDIMNAQKTPR